VWLRDHGRCSARPRQTLLSPWCSATRASCKWPHHIGRQRRGRRNSAARGHRAKPETGTRMALLCLGNAVDVAQDMIRQTIKTRTIYDALPVSFRLILLDTNLLVKKALHCLIQNSKPILRLPKDQSVLLLITYQTSSQPRFGTLKNPLLRVSSPPQTLSTS